MAGSTRTRTTAGSSPALANWWKAPGGTTTVSPGSAMTVRRPFRNFMVPRSTWKLSCCTGWTWPPGTRPSGWTTRSNASSAPAVSSEVWWKMNRSPLIGLSSTCPLNAIGASSAIRPGAGPLVCRRLRVPCSWSGGLPSSVGGMLLPCAAPRSDRGARAPAGAAAAGRLLPREAPGWAPRGGARNVSVTAIGETWCRSTWSWRWPARAGGGGDEPGNADGAVAVGRRAGGRPVGAVPARPGRDRLVRPPAAPGRQAGPGAAGCRGRHPGARGGERRDRGGGAGQPPAPPSGRLAAAGLRAAAAGAHQRGRGIRPLRAAGAARGTAGRQLPGGARLGHLHPRARPSRLHPAAHPDRLAAIIALAVLATAAGIVTEHLALAGWAAGLYLALLPMAIGAAIARYRLYDLDRIVSRTLAYGLLTVLLGGAYAGVVLGLGQLLGQDRSLVVAGATLAVAGVFQPARRRVPRAVDRRFNRRGYDAAMTIAAFSARLRQQIDLDTLTTELLAVVDQAMQPTQAALWLRRAGPPERAAR